MEYWGITDQPSHSRFTLRMSIYSRKFVSIRGLLLRLFRFRSSTPTLQHSITPTLHDSNTPSLHHSITPSLHHSITPWFLGQQHRFHDLAGMHRFKCAVPLS